MQLDSQTTWMEFSAFKTGPAQIEDELTDIQLSQYCEILDSSPLATYKKCLS